VVVVNDKAALAERQDDAANEQYVRDRLFTPGERLGWEWRKVEDYYSPFARQEPAERIYVNDKDALRQSIFQAYMQANVNLSIVAGTGGLLYPVVARNRRRKAARQNQAAVAEWQEEWRNFIARHDAALTAWRRERDDWEARERQRVDQLAAWGALQPTQQSRRLDIYGGTTIGWQALTTTLGASMLASGQDLFVLDLSQADVSALLFAASAKAGLPTHVDILPDVAEDFDVFGGLDAGAIKDLLVEALHASGGDGAGKDLAIYDKILGGICNVLQPHLTIERIHSGLRVLLRESAPGGDILSETEWSRVAELFGEESREVVRPHLVQLESQLNPLRDLGRSPTRGANAGDARCVGVAIGSKSGGLLNEVLVSVLVQRTIYGLREGTTTDRVLFVVGADLLTRQDLEKLDSLATTRRTRVVYLFRQLRGDVLEVVGGGAATAAVMRLGNPREAEQVADFIGRDHEFVLAQTNRGKSTTWSTNWGESKTYAGMPSSSASWGAGKQVGDTEGEVIERTHEYLVEPDVLKGLPETVLMLVELSGGGRTAIRVANCNPELAGGPRTSLTPFPSESAQEIEARSSRRAVTAPGDGYVPDPNATIVRVGDREALEAAVLERLNTGFSVLSYGPESVSLFRPADMRRLRGVMERMSGGGDELVELVVASP
jgi:hypothetical protein